MRYKEIARLLAAGAFLLLTACQQEPPAEPGQPEQREAPAAADSTAGKQLIAPTEVGKARPQRIGGEDCKLTMGYDLWAPYHYQAPDGTVMGIEIDLLRALLKPRDCELHFVENSWINLLEMLKTGEVDLVPGATPVAGRDSYAWFSIPYREEQFHVFTRSGIELPSRNVLELAASDLKIGLTEGYFYGRLVELAQQQHPDAFVYSSISEGTFVNLMDSKVDLMIEDPYVANMIMHEKNWHTDIVSTGIVVSKTPVSFMFSKMTTTGQELLDFNMLLADFIASGKADEIYTSYLADL